MENTNPQGSVTVNDAAAKIFGMLEPTESQDQPEAVAEQETEEVEAQAEIPEEAATDEAPEQVEEKPRYRVKVDSDEIEVDVDELIQGYQRDADYRKKTQTLAEQRKQVEAERGRIEEAAKLRDTYAQRLQVIEQLLTAQPEEDLSALKDSDPVGYAIKVAEKMEREKQLAAVRQERETVMAQQQAEYQQHLAKHLSTEAERLKAAIPELADDVQGEIVRKEIRSFAKQQGFSDQELSQVYDHRAVLTLYKAMQYDKLMSNKPSAQKKVAEAPKTLKPGVGGQKVDRDAEVAKKLSNQLKKTGRPRDAAALFERFL